MTRRSPFPILPSLALAALASCVDQPSPTDLGPIDPAANATQSLIITVTSTQDDGAGSLRQALDLAPSGAVIQFAPNLAGSTIALGSPLLVQWDVTIEGPAAAPVTLRGNGTTRLLLIAEAHVTLRNLVLLNGRADFGGAIIGVGQAGDGSVTIINSTLSGNHATQFGGAISSSLALTIVNSTISNNSADLSAGAILTPVTPKTLIINSTISGNTATASGGGIVSSGDVTVLNSTIAHNSAPSGGGILLSLGKAVLRSTIVANNTGGDCQDLGAADGGFNLSSDASCGFSASTSVVDTDPLLGPLTDNGGPTHTHALLAGSPAIDAGDCSIPGGVLTEDQRGIVRPQGAGCDMGSFEHTTLALAIHAGGTVDSNGAATIRGSLACSGPLAVRVSASLSQAQKVRKVDAVVHASGETMVACTGAGAAEWSLTLAPSSGAFRNGAAQVAAGTPDPGFVADAQAGVQLKWAR